MDDSQQTYHRTHVDRELYQIEIMDTPVELASDCLEPKLYIQPITTMDSGLDDSCKNCANQDIGHQYPTGLVNLQKDFHAEDHSASSLQ